MKERFETFTALISKIGRNIRKIKNKQMSEYDLRSAHVSCIYYLYVNKSLTVTELAERCDEDKATISRAIEFLVRAGFLYTCDASGKRYKTPIVLSEKGKEIGKEIAEKIDGVLQKAGAGLDENERILFYRNLSLISENLERIANN